MSYPTIRGVHRADLEERTARGLMCRSGELGEGEFCWFQPDLRPDGDGFGGVRHLMYRPPGCDREWDAPVTTDPAKADKSGKSGTFWLWNGDTERPTLKPSLGVPADPPYQWHGWLKNGVFSCV